MPGSSEFGFRLLIVPTTLMFAVCDTPRQPDRKTSDASVSVDAETSRDSGVLRDGGSNADTGLNADAATPSDAGGAVETRVERLADCQRHAGIPEQTACIALRITCGDLPPADVQLRVWGAAAGSMPQGNIVLGMGGTGIGWVVDDRMDNSSVQGRLLARFASMGFTVYEWAWVDGWWGAFTPNVGFF